MDADKLYHAWLNNGRPGGGLMESIHPGLKLIAIVRRFAKGWNPLDDPTWIKYKSRVNNVGKAAEAIDVLKPHLGSDEIFHTIPVMGDNKNVQIL